MGNAKVSKEVALFNLPAIHTCLNCKLCKRTCYARTAEIMWPEVLVSRNLRWAASMEKDFVLRIIKELNGVRYCRPHESGDFYSQEYLEKWVAIMAHRQETQFFVFTRVMDLLDFREMSKLRNVNVISSILPGGESNYDLPILVEILKDKYGGHICQAPRPYKQDFCMSICKTCLTASRVLFIQH
jgi:hypothetical protein